MKKISLILPFLVLIIFTGCAQKSGFSFFSKDKPYEQAISYTKKGEIIVSMENKAFIIATYLNPIKNYDDGEYFFVRVYIADDFEDKKKSGLFNPKYHIYLNGNSPLKIEKIEKDDMLAKEMPMVKPWYKLYLVKFPKVSGIKKLIFKSDDYGQTELIF